MTDPLLCPRIPLSTCDSSDYYALNRTVVDPEEKLAILDRYIFLINKATMFRPATREFIRHFDLEQAMDIIKQYYHTDAFFKRMTKGMLMPSDDKKFPFSLPDAYFILVELKCYIDERRTAITKESCTDTLLLIEQYKNHFSFIPPTTQRIEMLHNDQWFARPDFFVPESILYINKEGIFKVNDAIKCVNNLIYHIQNVNPCGADLEITSFLDNFRNMLFNNKHDIIHPRIIDRTCEYIFSISDSNHRPHISDCSCKYAAFVKLLSYTYKK